MELYKIWTKTSPCTAEFQIFLSKMICNVIIIALKPFKFMLYAVLWYDMIWRVIIYEIVCYVMRFQCYTMKFQCYAIRFQCCAMLYVVKEMLEFTVCMLRKTDIGRTYTVHSTAQHKKCLLHTHILLIQLPYNIKYN